MSIEITRKDIDRNIDIIYNNLKELKYMPLDIELSTEERAILFNEFYTYNEYGIEEERMIKEYKVINIGKKEIEITPDNIIEINQYVASQISDEAKKIIIKCGISLSELYLIEYWNSEYYNVVLNKRLLEIMHNKSIAEIGDYIVERTQEHPVSRNSKEITNFIEEVQEEKYAIAKDGEKNYTIRRKGETKPLYRHDEGIVFGGYVSAGSTQIAGNFGICEFKFDMETGMMYKDGNIVKRISEIMEIIQEVQDNITPEIQASLSEKHAKSRS